ncbi:MAG: S-methyl-5-thioribose-1-phosphate isomerase [bacterium]|nr:S-methyl-5-thioribose-1-phosphate isomerase [bacterium]MBU1918824.1 S-methyl-5-thioribose-1-phosphate isomerase [bacterium]
MIQEFKIIEWENNKVIMLDQRKLPTEETYVTCETWEDVAEAIKNMTIRGAPAIGVAAAMAVAISLTVDRCPLSVKDDFIKYIHKVCDELFKTRPTAVNLKWALDRMRGILEENKNKSVDDIVQILIHEAKTIKDEDILTNKQMGEHGQVVLDDGDTVLTHCNAGALATAGWGTAVGVVYSAVQAGKNIKLIADETRPVLQGARLTAWEAQKCGLDVTVICDNMAASLMAKGLINKIIVGADRIAANGDVANKIGTYSVAINAKYHNIPFYVAAPFSTIDPQTPTGKEIPIEERDPIEVTKVGCKQLTPDGISIKNPAFDVTPHELITGIITEKGIFQLPYKFI